MFHWIIPQTGLTVSDVSRIYTEKNTPQNGCSHTQDVALGISLCSGSQSVNTLTSLKSLFRVGVWPSC